MVLTYSVVSYRDVRLAILRSGQEYTVLDLQKALMLISDPEELHTFVKDLLSTVYLETLVQGNVTAKVQQPD